MSLLLWLAGAVILTGVCCYYISKAIEWFGAQFNKFKRIFGRVRTCVGYLYRRGKRIFKGFLGELITGEFKEEFDPIDEGIEIEEANLTEEVKRALLHDDDFVVAEVFN